MAGIEEFVGEAREGRTWWAAHSVAAYSQKDEIGNKHLDSGQSHRRQCGELVLPMLIVMPGYCRVGMPQRIYQLALTLIHSNDWSDLGKIAGSGGRLPVVREIS
ncbi:MAG TPA: hypothetical protein VJV58_00890 [Bradyrhizobium sp.]|nr:hypothetical protein [Bradyrhizobium sp.]